MRYIKFIILTLCLLTGYSNLYAKNYFVSKEGNNKNIGSIYSPFKSIQFAINKLKPGDTCFIRSGWYDENLVISKLGTQKLPIVIQAYKDEIVTIKPAKYNYRWIKHSKYIFKTRIRKKISQVFENDKPQFQAAFPTIKEGVMNTIHWGNIYATWNKEVLFQHLKKFNNIKGAYFNGICGRGLVSLNGKVIEQHNNKIKIQNDAFYWNKKYKNAYLGKGKGYLTGKLNFLDSPGEWFQDDKYFYYWPNSNIKNIVLRSTEDSIKILNSKYLEVKNIYLFGKNISVTNSSYVSLDKLTILYPTPYFYFDSGFDRFGSLKQSKPKNWKGKGVIISGNHNTLKNSIISHSWGDGVTLFGEKNIIFNSKISDCNWMGTDAAVINASGKKHKIFHCTLFKSGRSIITHRKLSAAIIKFNHIYDGGLLCDDLGLTYTYDTDGQNTEIAYNWLHNNKAKHYGSGIYLDNNHKNFNIHHNVVWNCFVGLTINQRAENDLIYNNTFIKNKYTMGCCVPFGEKPAIYNVITSYNVTESNLKSRDQQPFYGTFQKENHFIPHLTSQLVNPSIHEFQIKLYPNKRINIKKLGAYYPSKTWKAGCDISVLPVIDIPWYENTTLILFSQYFLFVIYILLFIKYVSNNYDKFHLTQRETFTILTIKIIAAFSLYFIYTYYYTNRDNTELFYYYDDALLIYKEHFFLHPIEYLKFITGFNSYSPEFTETLSQTIWWKKSLAMDWIHQLEIQMLIKLNSMIMLFSMGNVHIHTLFFAGISFFSIILFYKGVKARFHQVSPSLFFNLSLPSILLFTSNGIKETILVFFLSIFCYTIFNIRKKGIKILLIIVSLLGILILRAYYLLALIPGFIALISYNYIKKPILIFVGIQVIFMTFLLFNPWTNISENLTNKQSDMLLVAEEMNVTSKYEQTSINSNPHNLIIKIPEALYNVFIRYKGDNQEINVFTLLYSFENLIVLLLIILSFIYAKKDDIYTQLRLYVFSFCLIVSLFIGWTVPIVGAIVKYKAPMIMVLCMSCILLIDWGKIKKDLNI